MNTTPGEPFRTLCALIAATVLIAVLGLLLATGQSGAALTSQLVTVL